MSDIGRDEKAITAHAEYVAKVKAAGLSDVVWHSRGGELKAFVPFDAYRGAVEALHSALGYLSHDADHGDLQARRLILEIQAALNPTGGR